MVTRSNNRGGQRPTNVGSAYRADRKLQGIALAQSEKFNRALTVDGSVSFVWNKVKGTYACTCRGVSNKPYAATKKLEGSGVHPITTEPVVSVNSRKTLGKADEFVYVGEHLSKKVTTKVKPGNSVHEPNWQRPNEKSSTFQDLQDNTGTYAEDDEDDYNDDIVGALEEELDPLKASSDLGPSMTSSPKMRACPICYGMGEVDCWQLYNGVRTVLDFSNKHNVDASEADIETTYPTTFSLTNNCSVYWNNVSVPSRWTKLLRVAVFNMGKMLDPSTYKLYFTYPKDTNKTKNLLLEETFKNINGNTWLKENAKLHISIKNTNDESILRFTHVEFIFYMGDNLPVQIPDIEIPDDKEYLDWNLNSTFELPTGITLRESSYVVEGKYQRVWKVTSVTRKVTATGKSLGYTVNVRALHPFEKQYILMNMFGKPSDPFVSNLDAALDKL